MKFWKDTLKPVFAELVAALVVSSAAIAIVALAVRLVMWLFQ